MVYDPVCFSDVADSTFNEEVAGQNMVGSSKLVRAVHIEQWHSYGRAHALDAAGGAYLKISRGSIKNCEFYFISVIKPEAKFYAL